MKIVDICEFFSDFGGGVRTYVHQKLEACANLGCEATIIAPGPSDRREKRLGGEIIWVRAPVLPFDHRYHLFSRAKPVHDLLDEIRPDVVEGSSTWRGAWIAGRWRGPAAKVLFLHQDPVACYPQSLLSPAISEERVDQMCFWFWSYMRRLASLFDASAVTSDWFASRLEGFGIKRPLVSSFGIDKKLFSYALRSDAERAAMLAACGVEDPSAVLFVAISRHHLEKRLGTMIEAFDRFRKTRPAGLYLIGDGPGWRTVHRRAARVRNVHVAGHISDRAILARRLASADYFLHGCGSETFGLVIAEALASGLPIVVPNAGGALDLAHPAYSETHRTGDAASFAEAMLRIVARDWHELSIAARARATRLGAPEDHFARLLSQYAVLSSEKKTVSAAA
ncbi:MAG: glycosyltransferase [Alphaproteobacteria bacterium]|nr:glycosyltransferase [Alphaproteobacteria bacterium]